MITFSRLTGAWALSSKRQLDFNSRFALLKSRPTRCGFSSGKCSQHLRAHHDEKVWDTFSFPHLLGSTLWSRVTNQNASLAHILLSALDPASRFSKTKTSLRLAQAESLMQIRLSRACAPGWARTIDRLLKRELLYQLSYGSK
ncbi:MAG: hypothetical protein JWL82_262 [Parcubacteria group bacterium]|nr:hypothetical protein [Parcubacteria group bacterium]